MYREFGISQKAKNLSLKSYYRWGAIIEHFQGVNRNMIDIYGVVMKYVRAVEDVDFR